jgi:hypothetical protein
VRSRQEYPLQVQVQTRGTAGKDAAGNQQQQQQQQQRRGAAVSQTLKGLTHTEARRGNTSQTENRRRDSRQHTTARLLPA